MSETVLDAIEDFAYLANTVTERPTRIAELVPVKPSVIGSHDASGLGTGGVIFAATHVPIHPKSCLESLEHHRISRRPVALPTAATPWNTLHAYHHPIIWRTPFSDTIRQSLVSQLNPGGSVTNSDLELAGSYIHHAAIATNFDGRERTINSYSDNTPTVYWQRKGSITSVAAPTRLLRLQAIHQRAHRYVPRNDYLPGDLNILADKASRLTHLTDHDLLCYFNTYYPQKLPW